MRRRSDTLKRESIRRQGHRIETGKVDEIDVDIIRSRLRDWGLTPEYAAQAAQNRASASCERLTHDSLLN